MSLSACAIEAEPLAMHRVLETRNLAEVQELTSRLLGAEYRLEPAPGSQTTGAKLNAVSLGDVQVGYLETGGPVRFDLDEFANSYMICIQLSGEMTVSHRDERAVGAEHCATVFSPEAAAAGDWTGTPQLMVNIKRRALHAELEQHLERGVLGTVTFDLGMDLRGRSAQSWMAALHLVRSEFETGSTVVRFPAVARQLERLLITELLFAQHHNYTEALLNPQPAAMPRTVRRAIELIENSPEQWYGVSDLASAVGVSVRCLQEGFQRHTGIPPMTYVRDVRLARAHAQLEESEAEAVTVSCVANTWGFTHLGRFAAAYQKKYGVFPSETLRSMDTHTGRTRRGDRCGSR